MNVILLTHSSGLTHSFEISTKSAQDMYIQDTYFEVKNVTASGVPSRPQTPGLLINVPAN